MRVLSLFSGGGLGDYGLELAGMEIIGQVEIDDYCQKILKLRWPEVPKWRDIREVDSSDVLSKIGQPDLISGGFPCQGFSYAGKRRGKQDDRYLWPEMLRVISEIKPTYVLGENVVGIINSALDTVLSDLENEGYTCQTFVVPACAFDAPHRRDRVWILAYRGHNRWSTEQRKQQEERPKEFNSSGEGNVANAICYTKRGAYRKESWSHQPRSANSDISQRNKVGSNAPNSRWEWPFESGLDRVVDGCSNRVDRLKLLGNGQVVQVVQWIGERIMEFDKCHSMSCELRTKQDVFGLFKKTSTKKT